MTTVAERASRPLHVVSRVVRDPPVRAVGNEVLAPDMVGDVPLRRQWKIVVADLREIALLPLAAVDKGDVVLRKIDERIVLRQVWDDSLGMVLRIKDDICHPRLFPSVKDFAVARLAGGRTDIGRARKDRRFRARPRPR